MTYAEYTASCIAHHAEWARDDTAAFLASSYLRRVSRAEMNGDLGRIATAQANAIGWASR
jgi:hypothetical protein